MKRPAHSPAAPAASPAGRPRKAQPGRALEKRPSPTAASPAEVGPPARPGSLGRRLERRLKRALARVLVRLFRPPPVTARQVATARVERLLVVRQHNQMGDMVLALPALRALRRAYPRARLTFVTAPLCEELLRDHPDIDELIVFRKKQMWRPWELVGFIRRLRRQRPDLAVVMGTVSFSTTSALLVRASGAPLRVGTTSRPFGSELSRAVYNLELPLGPEGVHEVEHNLAPLADMGIQASLELPHLEPSAQAVQAAAEFLARVFPASPPAHVTRSVLDASPPSATQPPPCSAGPLVGVHPGAGKRANIWPARHFAAVAGALREAYGVRVVLTEGPRDADVVSELASRLDGAPRWGARLGDTLGLLAQADLVLSNDTGMAHVAAAVGTPVVVVFGPTDARRWRPAGDHVWTVLSGTGRIEDVAVASVLEAARAWLDSRGRSNDAKLDRSSSRS
ncbi:MAG: glycosyltransferase family 9 protein [Candidatus Krumholzibacteriia bacterium]